MSVTFSEGKNFLDKVKTSQMVLDGFTSLKRKNEELLIKAALQK